MNDDPYQALVDESRHREALDDRARQRWLRTQLEEGARFVGTLADLADQHVAVTLRTGAGTAHRGWLVGVAADHVVLRPADGPRAYVALDAVTDVRPEPGLGHGAATGERAALADRTLAEVLLRAVPERPRVHLRVRGQPDGMSGQLRGVGRDVVSVLLDGGRDVVYLRVGAITELAFVG